MFMLKNPIPNTCLVPATTSSLSSQVPALAPSDVELSNTMAKSPLQAEKDPIPTMPVLGKNKGITESRNVHGIQTKSKSGISLKPKIFTAFEEGFKEPSSVTKALQHEHWKEAMREEYMALMRNETWSLVPLPSNRNTIECKWVFKVKENLDDTTHKYKARLVAKGFHPLISMRPLVLL